MGAPETVHALRREADLVVCVFQPERMWAVGLWYEHFEQTADADVAKLLAGDPRRRDRPRRRRCACLPIGYVGTSVEPAAARPRERC